MEKEKNLASKNQADNALDKADSKNTEKINKKTSDV